ncbi:MAG TPA: hypothetical protein DEP84_25390, partial [Chloroflexi bacterium]|nr:hypothetical protein [Chloroflexota bacterium]
MAELLLADGWPAPDSPVVYLHEALSSDYIVVADPVVRQHELDGVVVGPQGLFVLYVDGPGGEVCPEQNGVQVGPVQPGRATPHPRPVGQAPNALRTFLQDEFGGGRLAVHRKTVGTGRAALHPSPPEEVRQATSALRAFLQDEFPGLQPAIHHLLICTGPDADAAGAGTAERAAMTTEAAPDAITSTELPDGSPLLDPELREALAVAVRDRRLTASQRATEPFIFRSGGQTAWTLREVVAHMDRHPDDGVYHLRNGTLARWLSEQGAVHLAELARAVMGQREVDARVPLETFLIGTGLLPRPSLSIQPPRLDFGYILAGQTAARRLRMQKAAGRGYLFGAVRPGDSWLHANPETFSGGALDAVVTVDSEALLISDRPYETALFIESTASDEPLSVPIQFRIVGMPSRLNRFLVRPLAGVLVAGLPGTAIGWLLGLLLVWMGAGLSGSALSPAVGAGAAGLLWAVTGGIR